MEREFKYIITCATSFTSNVQPIPEVSSSLERICNTYDEAVALLERLYKDAEAKEETKVGYLCNPKWISENEHFPHNKLYVEQRGSYGMKWLMTYDIHQDGEWNYLSKRQWL